MWQWRHLLHTVKIEGIAKMKLLFFLESKGKTKATVFTKTVNFPEIFLCQKY